MFEGFTLCQKCEHNPTGERCELFGRVIGMKGCSSGVERKPRNHFVVGNKSDEIRRMTDEELAIYLQSICSCIACPTKRPCKAKTVGDCQKVWLDYLHKDLNF